MKAKWIVIVWLAVVAAIWLSGRLTPASEPVKVRHDPAVCDEVLNKREADLTAVDRALIRVCVGDVEGNR